MQQVLIELRQLEHLYNKGNDIMQDNDRLFLLTNVDTAKKDIQSNS